MGTGEDESAARILVVDDDDQIRQIAVRQLRSLGYRVMDAASGAAALDMLDGAADVDLLFVDVTMPGMDGHEVAEKARHRRPGLPVVFASGNFEGEPDDGATRFLLKPYRKAELAEKVRSILDTAVP
ncbi:MAG: response regulator [Proteobacteria bacterium]|nr:response regulator [Pseudomonadota bacterium]